MVRLTCQAGAETSNVRLKKRRRLAAKPEAEWRCVVVAVGSASGEVMVVVVVEVKVRQWKAESSESGSAETRGLADGISEGVG